ncbi:hypothetical protein BN946_scf184977.g55 [Trametes cinnabarina]|uniref:Uncharacterized protein n=1 Tax=Pycnoporus cinnabarinus TaxID=5643 RepID=A0A060SIW0_PYCCI|nr:hypothetical protein BN946_scf184977.g55 [Trametes cinnabarina]
MFMVLDHPNSALPYLPYLYAQLLPRLLLSFSVYLFAISHVLVVAAQDVVNGQIITQGVSILDSPQPNSVLNAGSNTSIAIQLPLELNTGLSLDLLEVYLVSSDPHANITVSSGPQLLSQEPGSDVKHIQWSVPTCLQTGFYNLTLYETSHANSASFFAITPIPVQIRNDGTVSDTCGTGVNPLQEQPQPSNPPPADLIHGAPPSSVGSGSASPTGPSSGTAVGSSSAPTGTIITPPHGGGIITVTAGEGDITIGITDLPGTIVVEPSGGAPPDTSEVSTGFITIFKTVAPTATATLTEVISLPVTITLEETYVSTSTAPGTTYEFTVTQTVVSTTELVTTQVTSPQQAGLLPVNSGRASLLPSTLIAHWALSVFAFMYILSSVL